MLKKILTFYTLLYLTLTCQVNAESQNNNATTKQPLVLGVLPYASPTAILKDFSALRDYISEELGQQVIIKTSANYKTFIKDTAERKYDIVWTAPHFVLLALDTEHYQLCSTTIEPIETVIVVNKDSPAKDVKEIAKKTITTPPELAIVSMYAKHYLGKHVLGNLKSQMKFIPQKDHNASYMAAVADEEIAAVTTKRIFDTAISRNVPIRILKKLPKIPGIGIVIAKDLANEKKSRIKAILHVMDNTPKGKKIIQQHIFSAYREANINEFNKLRPFIKDLSLINPTQVKSQ